MDKYMIYHDLVASAGVDNHFAKAVTPFSDKYCEDYIRTFKELESEGKIALEECRVQETKWDKIIKVKGIII
jgi:hypothetical protein